MASVLHLLNRHPDYQTQTAIAQLTRDTSGDSLRTLGRSGDYSTLFDGLLRFRSHASPFQLIHAWGADALRLAALAGGKPILYSPDRFPSRYDTRWLRAVMGVRDVQVLASTQTMHRTLVQRGVPIERCHLVRPGVDFSRINRRRNDQLRDKLGFDSDAVIILACGECLRGANQNATILAATVLNMYDARYKLLVWERGPMTESAKRFASLMLPRNFIRFSGKWLGRDLTYEQLLPLADLVMVTADAPIPTLSIAISMAAALPIIATVTPTVAELLEDHHTALMVPESRSRLLARRVLALRDDPQLQWSICDAARTEAYEYFSMTRFVKQMKAVYEQAAAGEQVEVPQEAPGAGARFFGRG